MSWESLKEVEVKSTKKAHYCHGCMVKFPAGSNMIYSAGKYEGEFTSCYWCKTCDAYLTKYRMDFTEGVQEGEFKEYDNYESFKNDFITALNQTE